MSFMHELGITRNIIAIAIEHSQGAKVKKVVVEIGKLAAILPDAIRFCFEACAKDTPLEHSILEIREIPGLAYCNQCKTRISLSQPFGICNCGSSQLEIIQGQELQVKELELEEQCV